MPLTLTAASEEWISVEEVKRQANIKSSASDDEVDLVRGAAQDAVEGLIGPVLWRTVTEKIRRTWSTSALLTRWPVISVTTLDASDGTDVGYTLTSAGSLLDLDAYGDLDVTYVVGRVEVPDAVRQAALITAAHIWELQRGATPSPIPTEDAGTFAPFGAGYSVPPRAAQLLVPYLLPPAVA